MFNLVSIISTRHPLKKIPPMSHPWASREGRANNGTQSVKRIEEKKTLGLRKIGVFFLAPNYKKTPSIRKPSQPWRVMSTCISPRGASGGKRHLGQLAAFGEAAEADDVGGEHDERDPDGGEGEGVAGRDAVRGEGPEGGRRWENWEARGSRNPDVRLETTVWAIRLVDEGYCIFV